MGITLVDVAKKAEVSPSTVSRVINNKERISSKTKKKVLKAIQELGYIPPKRKYKSDRKKTRKVGIVFYDRFDRNNLSDAPFYNEVIKGVEQSLKNNYQIVYNTVSGEVEKDANIIKNLITDPQLYGLILAGYDIEQEVILHIKDNNIPLVLVDNDFWKEKVDCVVNDNIEGAYNMTNHLIELGHSRIAFLSGSMKHLSLRERYQGYKKALKDANIIHNNKMMMFCEKSLLTVNDGYDAVSNLINYLDKDKNDYPTAIFAANDELAIGAIKAVKDAGFSIPEDISVAGFDDISMAEHTTPALTTVRIFKGEMGRLTGKRLFDLMHNKNTRPIKSILSVEMVIRDSTGPVKKGKIAGGGEY